jgi:uncharacterized LabA/DUF88 family protein
MKRVIFYFDGFNFYNGLKEKASHDPHWKNYYWLDFTSFCQKFIPGSELVAIKYFTAPPNNNGQRSRQSALFSANKILSGSKFYVINGNYQDKKIECKKCKRNFFHPEEKRTDVNIATHMLIDCFNDRADTLVLVSADSDQVPTIASIKSNFTDKSIKVYFPPNRSSAEIMSVVRPIVFLEKNEDKFRESLMPDKVVCGDKEYTIPPGWKI